MVGIRPVKFSKMKSQNDIPDNRFTAALEAIDKLTTRELDGIFHNGTMAAVIAHDEIALAPINGKLGIFYRHLVPIRNNLVSTLASTYRRCFNLALAHPHETGNSPDQWACTVIQPAITTTLEWFRDWYILACDGENQYVQKVGTVPFVPGETVSISLPLTHSPLPAAKSWCAPAWLFQVSPTLGIVLIRSEHVPANDSEEKLGAAHTRLLLKAARRTFLWQLDEAIEVVRNEEVAAAGALPMQTKPVGRAGEPKKPKHWLKGVEGLVRKADFSRYIHGMTEKQQLAFSLKYEYQVRPAEIASRMGLDRKTAYEHIEAAKRKVEQVRSSEKRKANRAKRTSDL